MTSSGKYQKGDVVKFDGNTEPCIVYRVMDDQEQMLETASHTIKPFTHIEVMGLVATELLVPTVGHPDNIFGFEQLIKQSNRLS